MTLHAAFVRHRSSLATALTLLLFVTAVVMLQRQLADLRADDVFAALARVPPASLALSVAAMAGSYAALSAYDVLALHYLRRAVSPTRAGLIALVANAIGHNVGMAALSGGAVRLRLYLAAGLSAADVAALVVLIGFTFGVGLVFVSGAILLLQATEAAALLHVPAMLAATAGAALLAAVAGYVALSLLRRPPLRIGRWHLRVPRPRFVLAQLALAVIDLGCAAATLYLVLPPDAPIGFAAFVTAYVLAVVAGIISHVPAGLGVFEAVLLFALPEAPRGELLAAILAYRAVYFLLPLAAGATLWAIASSRRTTRQPGTAPTRPF